jgi:hypothetical protein
MIAVRQCDSSVSQHDRASLYQGPVVLSGTSCHGLVSPSTFDIYCPHIFSTMNHPSIRPTTHRLFLFGATILGITVGTLAAPTQTLAATLSKSAADSKIFCFSHKVESVVADGVTDTSVEGNKDHAQANATVDAKYNKVTNVATNTSQADAHGTGTGYIGNASSQVAFQEINFSVGAGDRFQFNFDTMLNVLATADQPTHETAQAQGKIAFALYEVGANGNLKLVDDLNLFGTATATQPTAFQLNAGQDFHVSQRQQSNQLFLSGLFSHQFGHAAHLRLVESKQNAVTIAAMDKTSAPEPATLLALVGVTGLAVRTRRRIAS